MALFITVSLIFQRQEGQYFTMKTTRGGVFSRLKNLSKGG